MPGILVVYASTHGHTAEIAARIADTLRAGGVTVALEHVNGDPSPAAYDAVVVGASIHGGRHQREAREWAERHRTSLGLVPSALFTVCLTAVDDTEESREATRRYLDEFVEATGWTPHLSVTFAGALQYREYDFLTRLIMRVMMHKGHHPTDISHDHDYTDWDAVAEFARRCASLAADRAAPA